MVPAGSWARNDWHAFSVQTCSCARNPEPKATSCAELEWTVGPTMIQGSRTLIGNTYCYLGSDGCPIVSSKTQTSSKIICCCRWSHDTAWYENLLGKASRVLDGLLQHRGESALGYASPQRRWHGRPQHGEECWAHEEAAPRSRAHAGGGGGPSGAVFDSVRGKWAAA